MIWQDLAIGAIQYAFAFALLPAIMGKQKPDRWTCAMTGGLLLALGGVFATLTLWFSVGSSIVAAICWSVLLFQPRRA